MADDHPRLAWHFTRTLTATVWVPTPPTLRFEEIDGSKTAELLGCAPHELTELLNDDAEDRKQAPWLLDNLDVRLDVRLTPR